ncbi:MAG: hypothetical protein IJ646_10310 [Clostridia bacterium]|nr:hypothetical protein [Clostridia bacterium]
MTSHRCQSCGAPLTSDEIALYRKLICRTAVAYGCLDCLSEAIHVQRHRLEELIRWYHETGCCQLFAEYES